MTDSVARNKARKICNRRNFAALANDTKWSEFFSEVHKDELLLEVKFIDGEVSAEEGRIWVPATNYLEGAHFGPELFVYIEWVKSKSVEKIKSISKKVGLVHSEKDNGITVYGYK